MYGKFCKTNIVSGSTEISETLPMGNVQRTYSIIRLDDTTLLRAPFIMQRFWKINLATGAGSDLGRAAPGSGQIVVW